MSGGLTDSELAYLQELWREQAGRGARRPTVLIVDDDVTFLPELAMLVSDEGFDCRVAESGAQALALLHEDPTILVLFVDLNMPGMNGLELVRSVREQYGHRYSFMMIPAHGHMGAWAHGRRAGCDARRSARVHHQAARCRAISQALPSRDVGGDRQLSMHRVRHNRRMLFFCSGVGKLAALPYGTGYPD